MADLERPLKRGAQRPQTRDVGGIARQPVSRNKPRATDGKSAEVEVTDDRFIVKVGTQRWVRGHDTSFMQLNLGELGVEFGPGSHRIPATVDNFQRWRPVMAHAQPCRQCGRP